MEVSYTDKNNKDYKIEFKISFYSDNEYLLFMRINYFEGYYLIRDKKIDWYKPDIIPTEVQQYIEKIIKLQMFH